MRTGSRRLFVLLLLACAGALAAGLLAGGGGGGDATAAPARPGFAAATGRPFEEPAELRSRDGVIRATFTAEETTFPVAGREVRGKAYRGTFIGPTLRVRPGDALELAVVNRLGQPTNLHEHGFHASPIGISDNVLRTMPAGSKNAVRVRIPPRHGPRDLLVPLPPARAHRGAGVRRPRGRHRRRRAHATAAPSAARPPRPRRGAEGPPGPRRRDRRPEHRLERPTMRTVNGLVEPVLGARTNQTQLLRLANISADIWYRLALEGARFRVIAEDANPVGRVWTANELILPPGKRYDVLVRWPRAGHYELRTLRYRTGPAGDDYPPRDLMRVDVSGAPVRSAPWPRSLGPLRASTGRRSTGPAG